MCGHHKRRVGGVEWEALTRYCGEEATARRGRSLGRDAAIGSQLSLLTVTDNHPALNYTMPSQRFPEYGS
jgi:hypothetical protein